MRSLLVCLILCGGCKKKEETKPAEPAATPAPETPAPRPAPGEGRPAMRRQVVDVSVEEVKAMMPTLDGGRTLKPIQKAERGQRVEMTMCFDSDDMNALAEKVKGKLAEVGWPTVNLRQHPQITDRVGVNANKPPFVFYGSVQRGPYPDCTKDRGQTLVTLSIHKIETVPGGVTPVGPRVPGAPGMRPTVPRAPMTPPAGQPPPQKTE
jgi:hypothetical protein